MREPGGHFSVYDVPSRDAQAGVLLRCQKESLGVEGSPRSYLLSMSVRTFQMSMREPPLHRLDGNPPVKRAWLACLEGCASPRGGCRVCCVFCAHLRIFKTLERVHRSSPEAPRPRQRGQVLDGTFQRLPQSRAASALGSGLDDTGDSFEGTVPCQVAMAERWRH